jgi:hypothetical protein
MIVPRAPPLPMFTMATSCSTFSRLPSTPEMRPELAFLGPKGTYSHQVSDPHTPSRRLSSGVLILTAVFTICGFRITFFVFAVRRGVLGSVRTFWRNCTICRENYHSR